MIFCVLFTSYFHQNDCKHRHLKLVKFKHLNHILQAILNFTNVEIIYLTMVCFNQLKSEPFIIEVHLSYALKKLFKTFTSTAQSCPTFLWVTNALHSVFLVLWCNCKLLPLKLFLNYIFTFLLSFNVFYVWQRWRLTLLHQESDCVVDTTTTFDGCAHAADECLLSLQSMFYGMCAIRVMTTTQWRMGVGSGISLECTRYFV